MENFEIITDSSANLQKALLDIYHIHILTLRFSRDKKEYRSYEEGVDRALDEVYNRYFNRGDGYSVQSIF